MTSFPENSIPCVGCQSLIDPLTTSMGDLQAMLRSETISSIDIVTTYLKQIEAHNHNGMRLHAMNSIAPKDNLIEQAKKLDKKLSETGPLSRLHGIPFIIKDTFCTLPSLGMTTTGGSVALLDAKCSKNAALVDKLQDAGMILLGKANLSELQNKKGFKLTAGWSAVGGQAQSPYVRGGVDPTDTFLGHSTPGGSSSGSAIAVAAGFCPISIGVETDGSVIAPANRAALYALKLTPGLVSLDGAMPLAPSFDSLGIMGKTARDVASLTNLLLNYPDFLDDPDLLQSPKALWGDINVGFVDPTLWQSADFVVRPNKDFIDQTTDEFGEAMRLVKAAGAYVVEDVVVPQISDLAEEADIGDLSTLFIYEFKTSLEKWMSELSESPVRSVKEMIEYNEAHVDVALPPEHPRQEVLYQTLAQEMSEERFKTAFQHLRVNATRKLEAIFADNNIHVVMGPADSRIASVAAAAGYPVACVPLGLARFNGRPFGMSILAPAGHEAMLLRVMRAWEAAFPTVRQPPPMLVNWEETSIKI